MTWNPNTVAPADRETCSIYIDRGMACAVIVVGVAYIKELRGFVDIMATPEAGETYLLNRITAWVHAGAIPEPPDDFFK